MQCALLTEHWLAAFDSRAVAFSVFLPLFSCLLLYSSALFFISTTTTIKMHHLIAMERAMADLPDDPAAFLA